MHNTSSIDADKLSAIIPYLHAAIALHDVVYMNARFVSGPAFATALAFINVRLKNGYTIDKDTSPAIFMVVIAFLMGICTMIWFKPENTAAVKEKGEREALINEAAAADGVDESTITPPSEPELDVAPASKTGIVLCLAMFFIHFYSFAIYETIMTPLVPALYNWSPKAVDLLFVGAGVVSLMASIMVKFASRAMSDYALLQISLACGVLGCLLLVNFPGT